MNDWFQIIPVFFLLITLTIFIRWVENTWFTPAAFFALMWTVIIAMSMLLAPGYYFSSRAMTFVLIQVFLLFTGSLITKFLFEHNKNERTLPIITDDFFYARTPWLKRFVYLGMLTGCLASVLLLQLYHYNVNQLFSIHNFIDLVTRITAERYDGVRLPLVIMLCLSITYTGNMIAGLLLSMSRKSSEKLWMILSLVPLILFTFIYTARAVFLFGAVLFFSTFIAGKMFRKGIHFYLFTMKNGVLGLLFIVFIPTLFLLTQMERYNIHEFSWDQIREVWGKLSVWFIGNFSGFSVWFDSRPELHPEWGKYTFGGIFELVSDYQRENGIFPEPVYVDQYHSETNIYTIFRFLLEDFSYFGTCLVTFILGFFSQWSQQMLINRSLTGIIGVSFITAVILWSFIASILAYNTILLAFLLFSIVLIVILGENPRRVTSDHS